LLLLLLFIFNEHIPFASYVSYYRRRDRLVELGVVKGRDPPKFDAITKRKRMRELEVELFGEPEAEEPRRTKAQRDFFRFETGA
jgi:hypothetical protein